MKYLKKYGLNWLIENTDLAKDASAIDLSQLSEEEQKDLGFKFKTKKLPSKPGIISHQLITIEVFDTPDGFQNIQFKPFHLIFGESSLAIFDAFNVNETAGLTRENALIHIEKLKKEGKTESTGAFIAGLTNWAGKELYMFFNVSRMYDKDNSGKLTKYYNRLIPHESLHLARALISISANKWLEENQGKENWYLDPQSAFEKLEDENEEYFAETLERITSITYDTWDELRIELDKKFIHSDPKSELDFLMKKKEEIDKRIQELQKNIN